MKKFLKLILVTNIMISLTFMGNIKAATISSSSDFSNVCNKQNHYYYFLYPAGFIPECFNIAASGSLPAGSQVACNATNVGDISKKTTDIVWENAILKATEDELIFDTTFDKATLPEGYKLLSIDTEAVTTFTEDDYAILFDAQVNAKSSEVLNDTDVNGIHKLESNGNIVLTTDKEGNTIYNHVHGRWSGPNSVNDANNIFNGNGNTMLTYYNTLDKEGKKAYRETIIKGLKASELTTSAEIGVGNKASTFKPLTSENINQIFNSDDKVTIKRTLNKDIKPTGLLYKVGQTDEGDLNYILYAMPAKFKVVIGTDCHERTCDDTNDEYELCSEDNTCSDEVIEAYEKCNPPKTCTQIKDEYKTCSKDNTCTETLKKQYEACFPVKNPETADLNIALVIIIITGISALGFTAYRKNKLNEEN